MLTITLSVFRSAKGRKLTFETDKIGSAQIIINIVIAFRILFISLFKKTIFNGRFILLYL